MPKGIFSLNPKKVERALFYLLIIFLPSQLAYHFWPDWAFIFGIRVDYLAPAIYLTDILIVLLLVISRTKIKFSYFLAFSFLAFLNIYFSISPWVSFFKWLKILELIFLALYVSRNKDLFRRKIFIRVLGFSLMLISVVGITQFLLGKTLGGPLYFLGERSFNIETPGIALQNIFGRDFLRAYSTFSHPNSLAGYLFVSIVIFPPLLKKNKLVLLLSLTAFLLTFSLSAFLGASLGLPMFFMKFNFNAPEFSERISLINTAKEIILRSPLLGNGLGTFVFSNSLMQPVHNIFLLIFSETGIFGFGALVFLFYKLLRKNWYVFVFILITGFFDHYWLTLQQNVLLLALVYGYLF